MCQKWFTNEPLLAHTLTMPKTVISQKRLKTVLCHFWFKGYVCSYRQWSAEVCQIWFTNEPLLAHTPTMPCLVERVHVIL